MKNIFKFLTLIIPFSINAQVDFINTSNSGDGSSALGYHTTASGSFSTAMGAYTTASGYASISMGEQTIASGYYSTAMGISTEASGQYSTAMGMYTISNANISTAMGMSTTASGNASTAMGELTTANNQASTAIGKETLSSGWASTAMGQETNATGDRSTSMGHYSTASADVSTAMGFQSTATGDVSTAMGFGTIAGGFATTAIGMWNYSGSDDPYPDSWNYANTAFVIGNGADNSNKSDAFKVMFNGDATLAGNLNVNSDARLKANIISLGSTLAKLLQIDGKSYTMKKDENKKQKIGVLAQDIEKVFPELVSESNGIKSVNYQGLVPVLINALKEQQSEIETYRNEVIELKEMVEELALRD